MERKYKYVIVDDNDTDRLLLSLYLKEYPFLENRASFSNPDDGLSFFEQNTIDLLFLDIEMEGIDGLEFLKRVQSKVSCAVFSTSHSEFALTGFELKAVDYMVKPVSKERINMCIQKVKDFLEVRKKANLYEHELKKDSIVLKSGVSYVNVVPHDILYLEALKDYTKIVLQNKKTVTIHGNLGSVLKNEHFKEYIRIHKSYAIRKSKIEQIKGNEIFLSSGVILPLSSNYKKTLLEEIHSHRNLLDQLS